MRQLPESADAIFVRLARDVDSLAPADVALVELMAYWLEIAKECRRQMAEDGKNPATPESEIELRLTVTDTTHGNKEESRKSPLLIVLRTATEQVRALAAQLGASPMARARLPQPEAEQLDWAEILFSGVGQPAGKRNE